MIGAAVCEAVNQPRIAMVGKDDWFIRCEYRVKFTIRESVGMFSWGLDRHQIDHIDDADFDIREMPPQQVRCRQSFQGWDVSGAGHDGVRLTALVSRGPL